MPATFTRRSMKTLGRRLQLANPNAETKEASVPIRALFDWLVIAGFLAVCLTPLIASQLDTANKHARHEKRQPRPLPALTVEPRSWLAFPKRFEAYYNDHFGLRNQLVELNGLLRVRGLGVSSSADVVLGKNGWLFHAGDHALDDYQGLRPWSPEDLQRVQTNLEQRRDWLAERGCQYVLVVAPNKASVYSEHLPAYLHRGRARLDQLRDHLAEHSTIDFVDLRPALRAARHEELAYFRTDTHWNLFGAYAGYREIMARLNEAGFAVKATPATDFQRVDIPHRGDLAQLLGVPGQLEETSVHWQENRPRRARRLVKEALFVTSCSDGQLPTTLLLHDSFGVMLQPYLSEHCRRLVLVPGTQLPVDVIENEKPSIVIHEVVERLLEPALLAR